MGKKKGNGVLGTVFSIILLMCLLPFSLKLIKGIGRGNSDISSIDSSSEEGKVIDVDLDKDNINF